MLIRGVQEPSDEAGAALLHDLRILGLLLIVKEPVIFRVAHGILHLLSAPTINQLRISVYRSRASGHPRPRSLRGGPSEAQSPSGYPRNRMSPCDTCMLLRNCHDLATLPRRRNTDEDVAISSTMRCQRRSDLGGYLCRN